MKKINKLVKKYYIDIKEGERIFKLITIPFIFCLFVSWLALGGSHKSNTMMNNSEWLFYSIMLYFFGFIFYGIVYYLSKNEKDGNEDLINKVFYIINSSTRPMPAHFTSDYSKSTGTFTRPKTFSVDYDQMTPADEYELASYLWHNIPSSEIYKKADHFFTATLITAEDISIGAFVLSKKNRGHFIGIMTKMIIEENLKKFKAKGYPADEILSDPLIINYFSQCEKVAKELAKNSLTTNVSNLGLAFSDNDFKYYRLLR